MSKKTNVKEHIPGWGEVILGAILSLGLGILLAAALLVARPVAVVKELPKEPDATTVYYIEGSKEPGKAREAANKRKAFAAGTSVAVNEDELNTLVAAAAAPAAPAAKPGAEAPPPPPPAGMLAPGAPNFRIRDGVMQISVPVTINALDLGHKVLLHARGGFANSGGKYVFQPSTFHVGSCPIEKLPFLPGFLVSKFTAAQPVPEDIAAAWGRLAGATVEGNQVKLTMP